MNPSSEVAPGPFETTETDVTGGNNLPDLEYVAGLFAALDGSGSGSESAVANLVQEPDAAVAADSGATIEERDEMTAQTASAPLALPAQCLLRDAVELKATLQSCAAHAEINLDVSAVERVDAAFMQLLAVLAKQRRAAGMSALHFIGGSAALDEAARVLGLRDHLCLPDMAA